MATLVCGLLLPGSAAASSAPTPVNTSAPSLTGSPSPGQTLTCSPGSWSGNPSSFAYVWLRDSSPIAGPTGSAYSVQSADQGHALSCRVTATNSGGEYTIAGLASGSYQVYFQHQFGIIIEGNYLPQYFNGQPTEQSANLVSVTTPNTVSGVDAQLQPGGQIVGRVTSAVTHAPISSVEVCAGNAGLLSFGSCATTDSAGDYTIVGLPSGSYGVEVSLYGVKVEYCGAQSVCPEQNALPQSIEGVSVTAPNTTSGIDLEMQPGGEIAGKVIGADTHTPLAEVLVCAYEGEITEFERGCATTGATGEYAIRALASKHYTLTLAALHCVIEQGCNRLNYLPQTIKPISVTAPDSTTVDAELQPGGQITGKAIDATTHAPLANASVCAVEEPGEESGSCGHTNSSGEYTVAGLRSGSYNVSFSASEYGSSSQGSIAVTAPNTVTGINGELQPQPKGQITGRVIDAVSRAPIVNIQACVLNEATQWGAWGCPTTNSAGEYSLKVPSGTYKVVFTTTTGVCAFSGVIGCTEPDYLSHTVSGVSVTAPNTSAGVDAELQPASEITGRVTSAATREGLAGVVVCAYAESLGSCGVANTAGGSASATSNTLTITAAPPSTAPSAAATTKPTHANGAKHKAASNKKLAKALKACRKLPKRKRKKCEAQARRRYAPKRKSGTMHIKRKR